MAMQQENSNFNFSLGQYENSWGSPLNYGTATLWYQTDKPTHFQRIDIQFYLGIDGEMHPIQLLNN